MHCKARLLNLKLSGSSQASVLVGCCAAPAAPTCVAGCTAIDQMAPMSLPRHVTLNMAFFSACRGMVGKRMQFGHAAPAADSAACSDLVSDASAKSVPASQSIPGQHGLLTVAGHTRFNQV